MKKLLPLSLFFVGLQPNSAALITRARATFSPIISRAHYNLDLSKSVYSGQTLLSNKRYYQNNRNESSKMVFLLSAITFTLVDSDKKDQKPSFYRYMPKWVGRLTDKIKGDEFRYYLSQQTDEELNFLLKNITSENTSCYGDSMSELGDEFYERSMYKEANEAYKNAEKEYRECYSKKIIQLQFKIGGTAFQQGNYSEAASYYVCLACDLRLSSDQSDGEAENKLPLAYEKCGHGLLALGNYEEADSHYLMAMALYKELHGENIDWFRLRQNVSIIFASNGKFDVAKALSEDCLEMMKKKNITPTQNMQDNHQLLVELAEKGNGADAQFCFEMYHPSQSQGLFT